MLLKLLADRKSESILPRQRWPHVQLSAPPWALRSHVSAVEMLVGPRPELHPISLDPPAPPAPPSGYLSCGIYSAHTHSQVYRVNTLSGTAPKREQEANLFICQLLGE